MNMQVTKEGEGEYSQTDKATTLLAVEFMSGIKGPVTMHEFVIDAAGLGGQSLPDRRYGNRQYLHL